MAKYRIELDLLCNVDTLDDENTIEDLKCYEDYISEKGSEIAEYLEEIIPKNQSKFQYYIWDVVSERNSLANVGVLKVSNININLSSLSGYAYVTYDYSVYHGCDDMNIYDKIDDNWSFKIEGRKVIFNLEFKEYERNDEI